MSDPSERDLPPLTGEQQAILTTLGIPREALAPDAIISSDPGPYVKVICSERRAGHIEGDDVLAREPIEVFTRDLHSGRWTALPSGILRADRTIDESHVRPRTGTLLVDGTTLGETRQSDDARQVWRDAIRDAPLGPMPIRHSYEFVCPDCAFDVTAVDDKLQFILNEYATRSAPLTLSALAALL